MNLPPLDNTRSAFLVLWLDASAHIVDAGIYSEESPTVAIPNGPRPLCIRMTRSSRGYGPAAAKVLRMVDESVDLAPFRKMASIVRLREEYVRTPHLAVGMR
jgi:hypothetical protein